MDSHSKYDQRQMPCPVFGPGRSGTERKWSQSLQNEAQNASPIPIAQASLPGWILCRYVAWGSQC
jgi:hypothetical protein